MGKVKEKPNSIKDQLLDKVLEIIYDHTAQKDLIFDDYLEGDSSMLAAIIDDDVKQKNELEQLKKDNSFNDFLETLIKDGDLECEDLVQLVYDTDQDQILDFMQSKGYAFIKLESLADKIKLEDFVKSEIYPLYSDEDKYSI